VKESAIVVGALISHYQVTGKLGAGGMGEVYRARDSKLNREVAIKVLPEAFARDDGRVSRFKREAQVPAALNHPHIATIYGLEETKLAEERTQRDDRQVLKLRQAVDDTFGQPVGAVGVRDQAFQWFEKGYQDRAFDLAFLRVDPLLDNLRSDPCFADLVRRVGL
jgi:hypothetical protein